MSKTVNVACIGAGYWGKNLIRNFHELGALRRICETDPNRQGQFAAQYSNVQVADSLEAILGEPDIDAVAIATPAETHGQLVRQSLEAGKDVFVEKPLCLSATEGAELVELAAEKSRILMVGHLLWYHPAVCKLKELLDAGDLGKIQYIYSNRLNLGKIRREENILWSFAPHDISVILGLLGEMPEDVYVHGGNYLQDQIADVTMSVFSFASGVKAHVYVSWLHPFKEQRLVVVGDKKMAVFDDVQEPARKLLLYPHSIEWENQIPVARKAESEAVAFESKEPLRLECSHFLDCVRDRRTPRTDGEEALRVLSVLEACQKSLTNPRTVVSVGDPAPKPPYFVHETSCVDEDVEIGDGTTIWHYCHVLRHSKVGKDCRIGQNVMIGPAVTVGDSVKIQNNVSVYEGVTLEDYVFCGPSMVFTNVINPRSEIRRMDELRSTLVRRGVSLGANCTVVCGITIGEYAFVGAGAVVTKDVPDFALIIGNPGRIAGYMCVCGVRLHFNDDDHQAQCTACERRYSKEDTKVTLIP